MDLVSLLSTSVASGALFSGSLWFTEISGSIGRLIPSCILIDNSPTRYNEERLPMRDLYLWMQLGISNSTTVDQVGGYFGMRSIGTKVINGVLRPVLNGQFTFQVGPLDQGFWPDGIYTAPTDDALKFDIQKIKDLGYNMIRKHIKIEPARWYYWADKLGILVWQDMPAKFGSSTSANQEFENELHQVVNEHLSSPSIIMWIVFNEGWGQFDQARVASEVKSWDPNRLVDNMSGVNCCGAVDGGNGDTIQE